MSMAELIAYNAGTDARTRGLPVDLTLGLGGDRAFDYLGPDAEYMHTLDPDGFTWWFQVGWTKADQIARGE